jgi:hypothetical protein
VAAGGRRYNRRRSGATQTATQTRQRRCARRSAGKTCLGSGAGRELQPLPDTSQLTANRNRGNWKLPIDPMVESRLLEGARVAREEGPVEALRLMNNSGHIKFLGGAFFAKWISFASATSGVHSEEVAAILDERVRDWIDPHTRDTTRVNLDDIDQ